MRIIRDLPFYLLKFVLIIINNNDTTFVERHNAHPIPELIEIAQHQLNKIRAAEF